MKYPKAYCRNCGSKFDLTRSNKDYCTSKCRSRFHNRVKLQEPRVALWEGLTTLELDYLVLERNLLTSGADIGEVQISELPGMGKQSNLKQKEWLLLFDLWYWIEGEKVWVKRLER